MKIAFLSIAILTLAALTASSSEAGGGFDWYGDDDGDGWNNATELRFGWMQDPLNPWDNFDVWGGPTSDSLTGRRPDCVVDARDAQAIAFRWGTSEGDPIYNEAFNLEPLPNSKQGADNDIDASDLQTVFARFGMTCGSIAPPNFSNTACNGDTQTVAEIAAERAAAWVEVQAAIDAAGGVAGAIVDNLAGVAASDPAILTPGQSKTYCVEVLHPGGAVLDVMELTMSASKGAIGGVAAISGIEVPITNSEGPLVYESCDNEDHWRSFLFGTSVAKITHTKQWGWVKDPGNLYYLMIGYNPPSLKFNDPSLLAQIEDSPLPTDQWYIEPFSVLANARTSFKQQMYWTWSSAQLESTMIVGPGESCIVW